jgi:type III secretory pathway component EscU
MGRFVFFPGNDDMMPSSNGLKGDIHYRFNDIKYETTTTKPLEDKIKRLCVLIVSKNRYAVGLEYISGETTAPVVVIKTENAKGTILLCKENAVKTVYNKKLTEALYKDGEIEEIIPVELWENTANLFKMLMRRDKNFLMKNKD